MPSSSLFLRSSTTLVSALSLLSSALANPIASNGTQSNYYALDTEYSGASFFDGFNFFTDADPTHGFVTYVDETTAASSGLISAATGQNAKMSVDAVHTYRSDVDYSGVNGLGRPSVRIESTKSWTHGLFIADIKHMPGGICGTWPAFWTLGETWPINGEIDIVEGFNDQDTDLTSAHTGQTCSVTPNTMSGQLMATNCNYYDLGGNNGVGCNVQSTNTNSYGTGFNANGGGIYAMDWTSDYAKIYFFPNGQAPVDIGSDHPDPSGWGTPLAVFGGSSCDMDTNFQNHRIVFDTTFCGM